MYLLVYKKQIQCSEFCGISNNSDQNIKDVILKNVFEFS